MHTSIDLIRGSVQQNRFYGLLWVFKPQLSHLWSYIKACVNYIPYWFSSCSKCEPFCVVSLVVMFAVMLCIFFSRYFIFLCGSLWIGNSSWKLINWKFFSLFALRLANTFKCCKYSFKTCSTRKKNTWKIQQRGQK